MPSLHVCLHLREVNLASRFTLSCLNETGIAESVYALHKRSSRISAPRLSRRHSNLTVHLESISAAMFALRRLPRYAPRLASVRGNATLEAAAATPAPPPPPPVTAKPPTPAPVAEEPTEAAAEEEQVPKGKQREWPTRRPHISLERPREWCRPIAKGVEPAYDYALRYILRDAAGVRKELEGLRKEVLVEEAKPEGERDEKVLEELRERVKVLEIQSEVNLPDVRWKARNGMGECWLLLGFFSVCWLSGCVLTVYV